MEKFAKLFEVDGIGQILVIQDSNDEGAPSVKFMFTPKDLGVCSIGPSFPDSDEGWDDCDKFFGKVDVDFAVEFITSAMSHLGVSFG